MEGQEMMALMWDVIVVILDFYLSYSNPMQRWPVMWGGSKSPRMTEVSEHTESHDIALWSDGKEPSVGLDKSEISDPILSVDDCRNEKEREFCLK